MHAAASSSSAINIVELSQIGEKAAEEAAKFCHQLCIVRSNSIEDLQD